MAQDLIFVNGQRDRMAQMSSLESPRPMSPVRIQPLLSRLPALPHIPLPVLEMFLLGLMVLGVVWGG
jgi:hypothetical protein